MGIPTQGEQACKRGCEFSVSVPEQNPEAQQGDFVGDVAERPRLTCAYTSKQRRHCLGFEVAGGCPRNGFVIVEGLPAVGVQQGDLVLGELAVPVPASGKGPAVLAPGLDVAGLEARVQLGNRRHDQLVIFEVDDLDLGADRRLQVVRAGRRQVVADLDRVERHDRPEPTRLVQPEDERSTPVVAECAEGFPDALGQPAGCGPGLDVGNVGAAPPEQEDKVTNLWCIRHLHHRLSNFGG